MDILLESDLRVYQHRKMLRELETNRQIQEALETNHQKTHILTQFRSLFRALGNARKIRIEVHFDYNEPRPKATGC